MEATIYGFAGSRDLHLLLPDGGRWVRGWLKDTIGDRCSMKWYRDSTGRVWWSVKATHLETLLNGLRSRYERVWWVQTYKDSQPCTTSCQNANADFSHKCECICGGLFHGNPDGNFKNVVGDLLISVEERQVIRLYGGEE